MTFISEFRSAIAAQQAQKRWRYGLALVREH
jgi:hypothetical protein